MVKSFEGGRGFAALIVALFHFKLVVSGWSLVRNGYLLVDLFFVLSGFLIFSNYSNRLNTQENIRSFVIRRFGRLFPLLVFSSALFVLVQNGVPFIKNQLVAHGYAKFPSGISALEYSLPTIWELLSTLTMTHAMGLHDRLVMNYVSWSISVEFYTYILCAIVCCIFKGKVRLAMMSLLAFAAYALAVWSSVDIHDCFNQGHCFDITYDFGYFRCVAAFFIGGLVFYVSQTVRINAVWLQALGLALATLFFSLVEVYTWIAFLCPLLFALMVLSISTDEGPLARLLKLPAFQLLGERSYSIYMMHPIILLLFAQLTKYIGVSLPKQLALLVVYVFGLVYVSGLTYKYIEDPFRRRFNNLASKPRLNSLTVNTPDTAIG